MKKQCAVLKKTRLIEILTVIGIIGAVLFVFIDRRTSCGKFQCIAFPLLHMSTNIEISESTDRSYLAIYTLPNLQFRAEQRSGISHSDAVTLTKVTVMRMQGQFETARSPYPGILSDAITCDKKFDIQPQTIQNGSQTLLFFTGFLNSRMQYGSCLDSEIQYTGLNTILYCDAHRSWYRIEALIPTGSETDIPSITNQLQRISCR